MPVVSEDTPIAELFTLSAQHLSPLVVVDDRGRFSGVVPRVTLLTAAGVSNGDGGAPPEAVLTPAPDLDDAQGGAR